MSPSRIDVLGAGVAGLCAATALAERGFAVRLIDRDPDPQGASWLAGGMLAPFCEAESAPAAVLTMGRAAADWWAARVPGVKRTGTLVVAPPRDRAELDRFAARTTGWERIGGNRIAELEPDLAGRFHDALFFADEAHLDPRKAMAALRGKLDFAQGHEADAETVVDCRGMAAQDVLPDLRAVRGEMLELHSAEITLRRTVRILHPRFPVYIVPRENGRLMIGGTMLESRDDGPISARSAMELLSAAWNLHPALAEAAIIATGTGLRPSFPDNLPAIGHQDGRWHLNGFYRHGFLLAPMMAEALADRIAAAEETQHAH